MGNKDRAAAVVIRNGRCLVMLRQRHGARYAVLPGGGIERGESPERAAVRELTEESTLAGEASQLLWVRNDDGRRAFYLRMSAVTGTPRLSGPELARSSPDNQYRLHWATGVELESLGLRPAGLVPLLQALMRPEEADAPSTSP